MKKKNSWKSESQNAPVSEAASSGKATSDRGYVEYSVNASDGRYVRYSLNALGDATLEGSDRRIRSEERGELPEDATLEGADRRIRSEERGELPEDATLEGADRRIRSEERGEMPEDATLEGADRRVRTEERSELPDDATLDGNNRYIHSAESNKTTANTVDDNAHTEKAPTRKDANPTAKLDEDDAKKNFAYYTAMKLLNAYQIFVDFTDESLLIYDEGMGYFKRWKKRSFGIWLRQALQGTKAEARLGRHMTEDIYERILATPNIQATLNNFAPEQPYLNVLNGVVDVRTGKLLTHSPQYRFLSVIHANYLGKEAPEARKFNGLMKAWFGEDLWARKQFLQALAYLFSEYHTAKISIYCVGDSNTGKSTLLNFIDLMAGEDAVSHVPLEDLSKEHVLPQLYGMKINSYAERDEGGKPLAKTGVFKAVSGGDWVLANPKHLPHFKFKSRTKCIFMSNRPLRINPNINEEALCNRFLFIDIRDRVEEQTRISEFEKMLFEEEADAILTLLVPVLREWLGNGRKFARSEGSDWLMEDLRAQRSSVEEYKAARCKLDADAKTTVKELKDDYARFCADNALEALAPATFIRDLVTRYRLTKRKPHNLWYVVGIGLLPSEDR